MVKYPLGCLLLFVFGPFIIEFGRRFISVSELPLCVVRPCLQWLNEPLLPKTVLNRRLLIIYVPLYSVTRSQRTKVLEFRLDLTHLSVRRMYPLLLKLLNIFPMFAFFKTWGATCSSLQSFSKSSLLKLPPSGRLFNKRENV